MQTSGETALGRYLQQADAFPGQGNTLQHLQRQGVRVLPKDVMAQGTSVTFADGATAAVATVIWATGYHDNSAWVAIPEVKDAHGNFVQRQGIAPLPHFYFIGRPWQRFRGSALLLGVGADAAWIKDHLVTDLGGREQLESVALGVPPARSLDTAVTL